MPFVKNVYKVESKIKSSLFLKTLGYSIKDAQKALDRFRVTQNNLIISKCEYLERGYCEIVEFCPNAINFNKLKKIEIIEVVHIKILDESKG